MGTWVALCSLGWCSSVDCAGKEGTVYVAQSAGWVLVKTNLAAWKVTRHLVLHRLL